MKARLQVLLDGRWEYVGCRNELYKDPITTNDKMHALPGIALEYFQQRYANHVFQVVVA